MLYNYIPKQHSELLANIGEGKLRAGVQSLSKIGTFQQVSLCSLRPLSQLWFGLVLALVESSFQNINQLVNCSSKN